MRSQGKIRASPAVGRDVAGKPAAASRLRKTDLGRGEGEPEWETCCTRTSAVAVCAASFELRRGLGGKVAGARHFAGGGVGGGEAGIDTDQKAGAATAVRDS